MAHRVTAPALQRAQRLLQQWVRPQITSGSIPFSVEASAELFEPVSFEDALDLEMTPFSIGASWGKPWHSVWFKMTAQVPEHAHGRPLVASIDLGFSGRGDGFQVEGMAWLDGRRVQAVQPDRRLVPLGIHDAGDRVELWVEASATPIIAGHAFGYGPTPLGDPRTSGDSHLYALKRAEVAVHHAEIESLAGVLHSMIDLIIDSDERDPQRARLFELLDRVADIIDVRALDRTAPAALESIRAATARWASSTNHCVTAVGHAHLDTAWLWPIRETRRKAVRTFANAVALLEANPDAVFCHSQAQHYAWVREDAPDLFDKVKVLVDAGRWETVGGMWVETDLNLPCGESLIRQFLHGRRAFEKWFGESSVGRGGAGAFLPDDFGYPGTLPQIIRHCGGKWFFSQKLSWNESNRFPHHSFWWEGIDGTRVFSHFSPVETYNALATPSQLRFAERNFSDHAGASKSLMLFGHGDGGGGPTQQMIDRVHHSSWWSDVPEVAFGTVAGFFDEATSEYADMAPTWVGEMYLEKHRGTYSSQLATKNGNRRCERLLYEWELWSTARGSETDSDAADRERSWQRVLTQQFHDIIPGSSIAWVHNDTEEEHRAIAALINERIDSIFAVPTREIGSALVEPDGAVSVANPSPVDRTGVEWFGGRPHWVEVPAMSTARLALESRRPDVDAVVVDRDSNETISISNGLLRIVIDRAGSITDIVDVRSGRSVLIPGAFTGLQVRRDTPAEYDAWDIDRADADSPGFNLVALGPARVELFGDLSATATMDYEFGTSRFTLVVTVNAADPIVEFRLDADWRERETRVQFSAPVDVLARDAVCGAQFGHVRRPRHANTSWDAAKFEVCSHRYTYVSEPGCGVGLLADGPRGYDVRGTDLRLTLLRSPSFPDPHCDEGHRSVEWGLYVDDGPGDVTELERISARRAHPLRLVFGETAGHSALFRNEVPGTLISAVKFAEDGSGDVVVRLWETRGARTFGRLALRGTASKFESAHIADGLESPIREIAMREVPGRDDEPFDEIFVDLEMRPFEISTLRLRLNR